LVTVLDFEKIVAEIAPQTSIQMSEIDMLGHRERREAPILVAEDSMLLSRMIEEALHKSGYVNTRMFSNGQELWEYLRTVRGENLDRKVALVITDIEMPQMDGHRLTKLIKDDKEFKHIPVVIFSSLISDEMRRKGEELGADEQLSKPEIGHLVHVIDAMLGVTADE
jgi:two-component system chemotaxis response regulator CheV